MRRLMLADFDPGELLQCLQARTLPPTCPHTLCQPMVSLVVSVGFVSLGSSTAEGHDKLALINTVDELVSACRDLVRLQLSLTWPVIGVFCRRRRWL